MRWQGKTIQGGAEVGRWVALIFAVVFGFIAGVSGLIGYVSGGHARLIAAEGVPVTLTVLTLERRETERREAGKTLTSYEFHATFGYQKADGTQGLERIMIDRAQYEAWREGDEIAAMHVPSAPHVIEFVPGELAAEAEVSRGLAMAMGVLSLLCLGLAGWLQWQVRQRAHPQG